MAEMIESAKEAVNRINIPTLLAMLGVVGSLCLYVITVGRYAEKVDQLSISLNASITQLSQTSSDRSTALSARLNAQQNDITNATVLAVRQDEKLINLEKKIDERGVQRDRQLEIINRKLEGQNEDLQKQLEDLRAQLSQTQLVMTRIETLLTGQNNKDLRGR